MILIGVAVGTLITGGVAFAVYEMIGTKQGTLIKCQSLNIYIGFEPDGPHKIVLKLS